MDNDMLMYRIRVQRDKLLEETDKYTLPDWPHESIEERAKWNTYRQALRDLPSTTEDPANPVWPEKPPLPNGRGSPTNIHEISDRIAQENAVLRDDNVRMKTRLTRLERKSTELEKSIIELRKQLDATVNT